MIRPARLEDLKTLSAISAGWPALPQWTAEHFRQELPRLCVLVEGSQIAGYAAMLILPPEAQILMVVVAQKRIKKGHGKALIAYLKEVGRRAGCDKLTLEVSAANAAALALYRSAGFVAVGRRKKFYADGSDAVLMDAVI